jgi:protein-arginine kinase activator protein McsA
VTRGDKNLGRDHPDTLDCVLMLAQICEARDRVGEARRLFERVLDAHIKRLGLDDFETASVRDKLASLKEEAESEKKGTW